MENNTFKKLKFLEDCKGFSLILPAISVSNAGQLAVDLLIQSTGAEKVENVWHEAFIPLIGAHPYNGCSKSLCTEFEVYQEKNSKTLLLQFRSPLWQNKEEDFINFLMDWFVKLELKQVVILSSLYDYERKDKQIRDHHVRFCVCPLTQSLYAPALRKLNCVYLETKENEETECIMTKNTFLPGAGFTQSLHLKCIENCIPCVSLFKFCSDGDNSPEAFELTTTVDEWLKIVPNQGSAKTYIEPPSWKYIFGGPSPQELFP